MPRASGISVTATTQPSSARFHPPCHPPDRAQRFRNSRKHNTTAILGPASPPRHPPDPGTLALAVSVPQASDFHANLTRRGLDGITAYTNSTLDIHRPGTSLQHAPLARGCNKVTTAYNSSLFDIHTPGISSQQAPLPRGCTDTPTAYNGTLLMGHRPAHILDKLPSPDIFLHPVPGHLFTLSDDV